LESVVVRASRYLYVVLAWLVVIGLVAQVYLIGLGTLGGEPSAVGTHAGLGWLVHLLPIAVLPFAFLARAGSTHWQWALASAVVVFLIPIFAVMRQGTPILGALHPVAAVLGFTLAVVVALNSLRALRAPMPENTTASMGESS
jgi:hypothetical protein